MKTRLIDLFPQPSEAALYRAGVRTMIVVSICTITRMLLNSYHPEFVAGVKFIAHMFR